MTGYTSQHSAGFCGAICRPLETPVPAYIHERLLVANDRFMAAWGFYDAAAAGVQQMVRDQLILADIMPPAAARPYVEEVPARTWIMALRRLSGATAQQAASFAWGRMRLAISEGELGDLTPSHIEQIKSDISTGCCAAAADLPPLEFVAPLPGGGEGGPADAH